jgi:hypothetical protein
MIALGKRQRQIENISQNGKNDTTIDKLLININSSVQDSKQQVTKKSRTETQKITDKTSDNMAETETEVSIAKSCPLNRLVTPSNSPLSSKETIVFSITHSTPSISFDVPSNFVNEKKNMMQKDECTKNAIQSDEDAYDVSYDDTPIVFDENQWDEELFLDMLQPFALIWSRDQSIADGSSMSTK